MSESAEILRTPFTRKALLPVVKALAEHQKGAACTRIQCLGGGSYGFAFLAEYDGGCQILKAYKIAGMNEQEAAPLKLLRKACPLKVPEVFYVHNATAQFPIDVLCMEKIEGTNALTYLPFLFVGKDKRQRFAEIVTDALGEIHKVTADAYGFVAGGKRFAAWKDFYYPFANDTFLKAAELYKQRRLSAAIFKLLEKGMAHFDRIVTDATAPTLCHGDLNVMNIMADKKTFLPTGFIDPFNSMWADAEYDLFQLNFLTGVRFKLFDTYKRKFKTSENVDLKCAFYALVNEVLCHVKTGKSSKFLFRFIIKRVKKQYELHGI
jgi:fructosamine-3-kinase